MPRLSNVQREGKAIAAHVEKTVAEAMGYETSDEDLPDGPAQLEPEPCDPPEPPASLGTESTATEPVKPKARQRKKVLAVIQPSAEVTEVVLKRPVKRRQVIVYADDVDEPVEIVQRRRKPGRPATQPKTTTHVDPPRITAKDVERRRRELEIEELEATSKKKIARRKDGSADGRSLVKRSEAQMESARHLVERNKARRAEREQETAKTAAKAVIEELAAAPITPAPQPRPPPKPTQSRFRIGRSKSRFLG